MQLAGSMVHTIGWNLEDLYTVTGQLSRLLLNRENFAEL
jgi:hypothetical protein